MSTNSRKHLPLGSSSTTNVLCFGFKVLHLAFTEWGLLRSPPLQECAGALPPFRQAASNVLVIVSFFLVEFILVLNILGYCFEQDFLVGHYVFQLYISGL